MLDLERSAHYSVFTLYNPYRIVVDLSLAAGQAVPAVLGSATPGLEVGQGRARVRVACPRVRADANHRPPQLLEHVDVPADDDVKPAPQVDSVAPGATLSPGTNGR